jgi:hypothetical protein
MKDRVSKFYKRFFMSPELLRPGTYSYQSPTNASQSYRLHLRIEKDGAGLLILNASTVLHLSQTAAEYAFYLIKNFSELEIGAEIARRYKISAEQAVSDYNDFKARLESLILSPDLDPVTFLDFEQSALYSAAVSAPYRLDCALTYRQADGNAEKVAPIERVKRELTFEEWKTILEKAWNAGIPHVIFTGGEPTLRPDLPDLISYAQKLGMVSGLLTGGARLSNVDYLHNLLLSGLDHIMIVLDPEEDEAREALRHILKEDIATTIHLTLTEQSLPETIPLLDYLVRIGARQVSISVNDPALRNELKTIQQAIAERGLKLIWDLPVPYSQFHPVALELAGFEEAPQGHGIAWLYVEPDGDVLPTQGHFDELLGNFLTDPWAKIWKSS